MQIPFDQFEHYIDDTILKRGLSYFNNDRVQPPEEISTGYFEAIVEGSDNYIVRLKVRNEMIIDHSCTCPYDLGPVCKHVVALLFYLQQNTLDIQPKKARVKTSSQKRKTVVEQLDELIKKVPVDVLIHYLKDQALNDPSFRRSFISDFAHYGKEESKSTYAKQLRSVIYSAKQGQGYVDYRGAFKVGQAAQRLLERASTHLKEGNLQSAFYISTAVLEVMTKALDYADDSNADIGDPIRYSMEILYEISAQELSKDLRKMIFDYAIMIFTKKAFAGWDWHLDMLDLAALLQSSDKEAGKLLQLIDEYEGSEYEVNQLQQIKFNILQSLGGSEAERYLEENMDNPSLREIALKNAFERKNYDAAVKIAEEGVKCDAKDKPGLVWKWYDWLLRIFIKLDDRGKVIEISRQLFLNAHDKNHSYYDTLKKYVATEDWPGFLEAMISELEKRGQWRDIFLLEEIYKTEEYWDRLLQLLKANVTLNRITVFEPYLKEDHSDELIALYRAEIIDFLSKKTGRTYYREACRYIRRMIKLGGREEADKLIDFLRNEFPARRALQEELDKV